MLYELVEYLTQQNVVKGDAKDTYRDYVPDEPDKLVALQEYNGVGSIPAAEGVARRVQIIARSSLEDPDWASTKIWQIFNVLDVPDRIIDTRKEGGNLWGVFDPLGTPHKMRVDEHARPIYGFNLSVITSRD